MELFPNWLSFFMDNVKLISSSIIFIIAIVAIARTINETGSKCDVSE